MSSNAELEDALRLIQAAHEEVSRICSERWAGRQGWRTSMPAELERDSDLIIGEALLAARKIILSSLPAENGGDDE